MNLKATQHCQSINTGKVPSADLTMSRIAAGDQVAFEQLISDYGESVAKLIGRLTAWHTDSDDILQEVFLTVWQRAGSYDGRGSIEGWLKRIAINRCRNHFRALNSIRRKLEKFAGLGLKEPTHSCLSKFEVDEANDQLRGQIEKLPQQDRMILVLYYLEELTGEEVAGLLKVKLETFHVQLHRARQRLRNLIDDQNND